MQHTSHNLLQVCGAAKTYATDNGPVDALGPCDLNLGSGATLALVGPSGCGKTTLLLLLAGLERPSKGRVLFKGQHLAKPHREIALVLQDYGLFPWKTVVHNVELGLRIRGDQVDRGRIRDLLQELDIADKIDAYPQQLSGGQKQRVALARALILNPSLLLMDEPFAALDTLTRERLQDLVASAWQRRRFGMVLVTHNIQEAVRLGQKIVVMGGNPGRIRACVENPLGCGDSRRGSDELFDVYRAVRGQLEQAA